MARELEAAKTATMLRQGNDSSRLTAGRSSVGRRSELDEMRNLIRTNKGVFRNPEVRKQARRVYRMLEKVAKKGTSEEVDPKCNKSSQQEVTEKVNLVVYSQYEVQSLETDVSSIEGSEVDEVSEKKSAVTMSSEERIVKERESGAKKENAEGSVDASTASSSAITGTESTEGFASPKNASRFGYFGVYIPVCWCGPDEANDMVDDFVTGENESHSIRESDYNVLGKKLADPESSPGTTGSSGLLADIAREHCRIQLDAATPTVCLERIARTNEGHTTATEESSACVVKRELKAGLWLSYDERQWKVTPFTS